MSERMEWWRVSSTEVEAQTASVAGLCCLNAALIPDPLIRITCISAAVVLGSVDFIDFCVKKYRFHLEKNKNN